MRLLICGSYAVASDHAVFPVANINYLNMLQKILYDNIINRSFACLNQEIHENEIKIDFNKCAKSRVAR